MPLKTINLAHLRQSSSPYIGNGEPAAIGIRLDPAHTDLSRRQLLRWAGGAAAVAGTAAGLRKLSEAAVGPFSVAVTPGRLAFKLAGRERWVLDVKAFGGNPRLTHEQTGNGWNIALTGATYPGTVVPAGLTARLHPGILGWQLQIRLALGGFAAQVPFERWLLGLETLAGRAQLDTVIAAPWPGCEVAMRGPATLTLRPDWSMDLQGPGIGRFTNAETVAGGHAVLISSLTSGAPSALLNPPPKRTLVTLHRGGELWPQWPELIAGPFAGENNPFNILRLEAGIEADGQFRYALVAESAAAGGTIAYTPRTELLDDQGRPFSLPLRHARLAVSEGERALTARLGSEPVWAHADGCSFQVGAKADTPIFEWARSDQTENILCKPALLAISTPLAGAAVKTAAVMPGLELNLGNQVQLIPGIMDKLLPITIPIEDVDIEVTRPDDLLVLGFKFVNMGLEAAKGFKARLVRARKNAAAHLIVTFPPQSIGEHAYFEQPDEPRTGLTDARLSAPSRLVFLIPSNIDEIPFNLESLLDWTRFEPSVVAAAQPPPAPKIDSSLYLFEAQLSGSLFSDVGLLEKVPPAPAGSGAAALGPIQALKPVELLVNSPAQGAITTFAAPDIAAPGATETAIAAPYGLILSPHKQSAWIHRVLPAGQAGRFELWHTRLAVQTKNGPSEADHYLRAMRAVWAPGFQRDAAPKKDERGAPPTPLTPNQRYQIVRATADFKIRNYTPLPIQVNRFALSALGAWIDTRGVWVPPGNVFALEEWRHLAAMGRDHYVRTVEKGYLFPFGHQASQVEISERKFLRSPTGQMMAYLRKRRFIIIRQPVLTYPIAGQPYSGRQLPFRSVTMLTLSTPSLNMDANQIKVTGVTGGLAQWLKVGSNNFQFNISAIDHEGNRTELSAPLIFVSNEIADNAAVLSAVAKAYSQSADVRRPAGGQSIAYAPATPGQPGDTALETVSITFGGGVPAQSAKLSADQARFYPLMTAAAVRTGAADRLGTGAPPANIAYHDLYLKQGFAGNPGEVFARTLSAANVQFPADQVGGIATPNLYVGGFSRYLGPIGGSADSAAQGTFDPAQYFSDAKVLGGLLLQNIVEKSAFSIGDSRRVPRFSQRIIYNKIDGKENPLAGPRAIQTRLHWEPKVKTDPQKIFVAGPRAALKLVADLLTPLDGSPPTYEIDGDLQDFTIDLFPPVASFIQVEFDYITFSAKSGSKPAVNPKIRDVKFAGPLTFVAALGELLKPAPSQSGPYLDVSPSGARAGLSFAIPTVEVGIMSIKNIKLMSEVELPFTGAPVRYVFRFCERQDPFQLVVSLFGGGGFFGLALGLDGVEILEASLEFGAAVGLDIGVAQGSVQVMAGIYFKIEGDGLLLSGYLRINGSLRVIGLITITAEFYMSLSYEDNPKADPKYRQKVWGQASLMVKVSIAIFSTSVSLSVERVFKGGGADPLFKDLVAPGDWADYCEAFA